MGSAVRLLRRVQNICLNLPAGGTCAAIRPEGLRHIPLAALQSILQARGSELEMPDCRADKATVLFDDVPRRQQVGRVLAHRFDAAAFAAGGNAAPIPGTTNTAAHPTAVINTSF